MIKQNFDFTYPEKSYNYMASHNLGDRNALERSIRLAARLSVVTGYTCVEGLG